MKFKLLGRNLLLKMHGRKYRVTNENNKLTKLLLRSDGHSKMKLLCILLKRPQLVMNCQKTPHIVVVTAVMS